MVTFSSDQQFNMVSSVTNELMHPVSSVTNELMHPVPSVTNELMHPLSSVTDELMHPVPSVPNERSYYYSRRSTGSHKFFFSSFLPSVILVWLTVLFSLFSSAVSTVPLRWSKTLGDYMVLQADVTNILWGFGTPGATVTTTFDGETLSPSVTVGTDSIWRQPITSQPPDFDPLISHTFTVTDGTSSLTMTNVKFGLYWQCGGQSNMAFTVNQAFNATTEVQESNQYQDYIRIFTVGGQGNSSYPSVDLETVVTPWIIGNNLTIGDFSAVCYFFARDLLRYWNGTTNGIYNATHLPPIGLVSNNVGGTSIELWSAADDLQSCYDAAPDSAPYGPPYVNGSLYNGMILPYATGLTSITGWLFYQAEANAPPYQHAPEWYACLFPRLITNWRSNIFTERRRMMMTMTMVEQERPLERMHQRGDDGRVSGAVHQHPQSQDSMITGSSDQPTHIAMLSSTKHHPPLDSIVSGTTHQPTHNKAMSSGTGHPQAQQRINQRPQKKTLFPLPHHPPTDISSVNANPIMPFLFVQLAPFNGTDGWEDIRQAQLTGYTSLPNVGFGTMVDNGDTGSPYGTYHPRNKQLIGQRLANTALSMVYNAPTPIRWLSPLLQNVTFSTTADGTVAVATASFVPASVPPEGLTYVPQVCPSTIPLSICSDFSLFFKPGPVPTYSYLGEGFLAAGNDCGNGIMTVADAYTNCTANPICVGFTFNANVSDPSLPINILFKSSLNYFASTGWQAYGSDRDVRGIRVSATGTIGGTNRNTLTLQAPFPNGTEYIAAAAYGWSTWPLTPVYSNDEWNLPMIPWYYEAGGDGISG